MNMSDKNKVCNCFAGCTELHLFENCIHIIELECFEQV